MKTKSETLLLVIFIMAILVFGIVYFFKKSIQTSQIFNKNGGANVNDKLDNELNALDDELQNINPDNFSLNELNDL